MWKWKLTADEFSQHDRYLHLSSQLILKASEAQGGKVTLGAGFFSSEMKEIQPKLAETQNHVLPQ